MKCSKCDHEAVVSLLVRDGTPEPDKPSDPSRLRAVRLCEVHWPAVEAALESGRVR